MPGKTHAAVQMKPSLSSLLLPRRMEVRHGRTRWKGGWRRCCRPCGLLFELLRCPVSQRRMQTASIVIVVDELFDMARKLLEIAVLPAVDFLLFQRLHKALAKRIRLRRRLRLMRAI